MLLPLETTDVEGLTAAEVLPVAEDGLLIADDPEADWCNEGDVLVALTAELLTGEMPDDESLLPEYLLTPPDSVLVGLATLFMLELL